MSGWWAQIRAWFSPPRSDAAALMDEMRRGAGPAPAEWTRLRGRLATLVLSEADQQRLWRRAHRGADETVRLLSGITQPSPAELERLRELVAELETGR